MSERNLFQIVPAHEWFDYPAEAPTITRREHIDGEDDPEGDVVTGLAPWWDEAYVGFAAKIRTNMVGAEVREIDRLRRQIAAGEIVDDDEIVAVLARHIVDWTLAAEDPDGNLVKVAPPAEGGPASWHRMPIGLGSWLMSQTMNAYLPKARPSGKTSGSPAGTTDMPTQGDASQATTPPAS
jgi:hypothetical protein